MAKKQKVKEVKTSLKGSRFWGVLWFIILFLIDQVTKLVAEVYLGNNATPKPLKIVPNVLEFAFGPMHYNRGFAFSAFAGENPWLKFALVMSTAVLMLILIIVYFKSNSKRGLFRCALVLIIAGGMANFVERVYFQVWDPATASAVPNGVRDMLHVVIFFDFGYCNFADFFIVGGAILMILSLLFFDIYAICPVGKYRKIAKELSAQAKAKKAEKQKENQTDTAEQTE